MILVREIMTDSVFTIKADENLLKARELMSENNIRHIPVVNEDHNLVGLLTQRDLLKAASSNIASNSQNVDEQIIPVAEIMKKTVKCIHPDESLKVAGLIIQKYKYGCLPIVEDEKVIGIITDSDFVGVAINLIEQMDHHEEIDLDD